MTACGKWLGTWRGRCRLPADHAGACCGAGDGRALYVAIAIGLTTASGCGMGAMAETIREDRSMARVHDCRRHVVQYTDDEGRQHTVEDSRCRDTKEPK